MAIEVFNRFENKYMLKENKFLKIQEQLAGHMELDAYNQTHETYPICNIYYDTDDSYLIRTSLSKPGYKEKLRLRSYGTPDENSKVYVEIKKKFRGTVNKRRSAMKLHEAYTFLSSGKAPDTEPYMNRQVLREVEYMLAQHKLSPKVYLSYERRAFFGTGQSDLRVSFDTNIITRRHDLRLESGIYGGHLLEEGQWLMEIKTAGSIPIWLAQMLSEHQIYPSGFSKYGAEYKNTVASGNQGERKNVILLPIPIFSEQPLALARA